MLKVSVSGSDTPIVGSHVVTSSALEFHPRFPFDPGRSYAVRFDSARLAALREGITLREGKGQRAEGKVIEAVVALPAVAAGPPTVVAAVHPSVDRWPANLLRFYIHFSGPMSRTSGVGLVHVVGEDGEDVADALLPAEVDFWNEDRTRYTVFFDPGRVKRGILPNREMGRALVPGRRYTILVDAAWRDEVGRPLRESYRHQFVVGPPIEQALDVAAWRVRPPAAGARDPLVIRFPSLMDHALLRRALTVVDSGRDPVAGVAEVSRDQMEWRYTPREAWPSGGYEIVAASILEDPAGNRIGRAFEVDPSEAPRGPSAKNTGFPLRSVRPVYPER